MPIDIMAMHPEKRKKKRKIIIYNGYGKVLEQRIFL